MLKLQDRTAKESFDFHVGNQPSPRFVETCQAERILLSRELVSEAIAVLRAGNSSKRLHILELGCGRADISGYFSVEHSVMGYECCPRAALGARHDWPWMDARIADAQTAPAEECDIVILTEFLEHVFDPFDIVRRWLPLAKYSVISSPNQGDRGDFREGGHLSSFDPEDFPALFSAGGHEIVKKHEFPMAMYQMFLALGRNQIVAKQEEVQSR